MNATRLVPLVLCAALGACGEPAATPAKPPAPAKPEPAKPEPTKAEPPAPLPAPAAPSAVHATKDPAGHDWASHMGDLPFGFDLAAAQAAAAKSNRSLMLYFTSPN